MDSKSSHAHGHSSLGLSTLRERIQISEVIHLITLRKKLILSFALLAIAGTILAHVAYIPAYTSTVKLEVLSKRENLLSKFGGGEGGALSQFAQDDGQDIQRFVSHLRSSNFYQKTAEILREKPEFKRLNLTQPAELSVFRAKFWYTRFIKDRKFSLIYKQEFTGHENDSISVDQLASIIQEATTVDQDGLQWISLSVKTFDPSTSITIVNLAAETFSQLMMEREQNELNELHKFVRARLTETSVQLKENESALVKFKQANSIISAEAGDKIFTDRVRDVETQYESVHLKIAENENLIDFYKQKLKESADFILSDKAQKVTSDSDPHLLTRQLDSLRQQRYLLATQGFKENDPKVVALDSAIQQTVKLLKKQLRSKTSSHSNDAPLNTALIQGKIGELKNTNKILATQMSALEDAKIKLNKSVARLPKIEQELFSRTESLKSDYELFSSLRKKAQEIEIQKLAVKPPVRVDSLTKAAPNEPRLSLIMRLPFAILVGMFFGSVVVLLLELADTTIKHASDLEACDLTILGNIPHIDSKVGAFLKEDEVNSDLLVCDSRPDSPEAMAFKYLREQMRVLVNVHGKPARSFTITSANQHDGKSLISCNLAITLARLGKKVILVDCDFRARSVHRYFNLEPSDGLTAMLTDPNAKLEELILKNKIPNLDILPVGLPHPHPTELVGSETFRTFISQLMTKYDYVLLDAPPAGFVADAPVMAVLTDIVLLVTNYRKSTRTALLMAHRKIFQISHKRAYGILNNVPKMVHEFTPYVVRSIES